MAEDTGRSTGKVPRSFSRQRAGFIRPSARYFNYLSGTPVTGSSFGPSFQTIPTVDLLTLGTARKRVACRIKCTATHLICGNSSTILIHDSAPSLAAS
jgi:hypothetical protein